MISVSEVVEDIIKKSPLLSEGLSQGLINTSALARKIRKEVELKSHKEVSQGAVVMALQRLSSKLSSSDQIKNVFHAIPDMVVRSNLFEYTLKNSVSLTSKQKKLLDDTNQMNSHFVTITAGVFETTIIASNALKNRIYAIFKEEEKIGELHDLASITIRLTPEIVVTPGAYAQILKLLAWEGINITEVVSTYLELTIILQGSNVDRAFSVLKNSFK